MWLMGQYIRSAIVSTQGYVVSVPIMDKKGIQSFKPQKYPNCPHIDENEHCEHSAEWVENEKKKTIAWLNSFKRKK